MYLSIIVPIYKVEAYIENCLISILSQRENPEDVEIILVNDGTPDNSAIIAAAIIEGKPNTQIIHQENAGLSAARNTGLDAACGAYVWFVDSDDWLLTNALKDVFEITKKYPKADVIATILEMNVEGEKGNFPEYNPQILNLSGAEYLKYNYRQGASQRFIIKRQFLINNALSFYKGLLHEDGLFGYTMLYLVKHVIILPKPVYAYRIRQRGSIMSTITMRTPNDMLYIHKKLVKFCNDCVAETDRKWFRQEIFKVIIDLFQFSNRLAFNHEFAKFYKKNKDYFDSESSMMLQQGFMRMESRIVKYCPLSLMRIKCIVRKVLRKA